MKKSFALIELIVAMVVASVIAVALFGINSSAIDIFGTKKISNLINQEFLTCKLALQNRLVNAKVITISNQKIDFYELDHYALEQNIVSGFAELDSNLTTKTQLKTKCLTYLPTYDVCVGFEDACYDVEAIESDMIIFKDKTSPKKMSENYFLYMTSSIYCEGDSLKYSGDMLLDGLSKCLISKQNDLISFDLCKQFGDKNICKTLQVLI